MSKFNPVKGGGGAAKEGASGSARLGGVARFSGRSEEGGTAKAAGGYGETRDKADDAGKGGGADSRPRGGTGTFEAKPEAGEAKGRLLMIADEEGGRARLGGGGPE